MKLVGLGISGFVYFSVATVLALLVGAGVLYSKGTISGEKFYEVMAVIHEVEDYPSSANVRTVAATESVEQPSVEEVELAQSLARLDLDLRENAVEKGLLDLRTIEQRLQLNIDRFKSIKGSFDDELKRQLELAEGEGLKEVKRALEVLQPRMAKEHIMRMIKEGDMGQVLSIMKSMPTDKLKKIATEFKTDEEVQAFADILKELRDTTFLQNKQARLDEEFNSENSADQATANQQ